MVRLEKTKKKQRKNKKFREKTVREFSGRTRQARGL
jgi:hypothetical protein